MKSIVSYCDLRPRILISHRDNNGCLDHLCKVIFKQLLFFVEWEKIGVPRAQFSCIYLSHKTINRGSAGIDIA